VAPIFATAGVNWTILPGVLTTGKIVVLVSPRQHGKSSLNESFGRQASGTFDQTYLDGFIPRMIALLKPESINEVKAIMSQFGQGFTKSQFVMNIFYGTSKRETFRC
jgi:chloramphenicol 3-O-phosphotransferase